MHGPAVQCVFTGLGLATPQGVDTQTTWNHLLDGRVLHDRAGRVPVAPDGSSRVSQIALLAAREALLAGGWNAAHLADSRTAILVGTSKGPIEDWLDPSAPRRGSIIRGVAAVVDDLARALGHGYGPRLTLAAACASGLHALIRAKCLLEAGLCDRALVVAAESSTGELFQATFRRIGVLADPEIGCRPFDRSRQGFLLSESAAAVCLEAAGGDRPGIRLGAGVMLGDATHITGTDPSGRAFRRALQIAAAGQPIDLVHAHGTGTQMNDPIELAAIADTCASQEGTTDIYSHKHAIGHTQGAAGLLGVALNLLMHRHQVVLPNANTPDPIGHDTRGGINSVRISQVCQSRSIAHSVVLAAGFGGPVAAVSLMNPV